ncbi:MULTISPECIES: dihydromonapterin reductase [Pseudomonas]|uniref:Dihydromonapterin reductase n=1 Tax=Pseudomonas kuykendallii TaxID=1007099 RepID=A0A2W5D5K2_9PSED|nr:MULTISPECIES: dihydromonapterin reductase [Pseudomonas]PZP23720.1 MAG: dihydromonapterin reductase [Pseudomonas kuykendallii]
MTTPLLITGTSKRVGYELALSLAERGYDILSVNRTDTSPKHPRIVHFQADLMDRAQREQLVAHVRTRHDALRGIVHNASQWLDDSLENLEAMLRLHVEAPFQLNLELGDWLKKAGRADIIHICDESASRGSKNHVAYAASKAALQNMTLSFAEMYAPNVRVNSISPGLLILKEDSTPEYVEKTFRKALLEFEPGAEPLIQTVAYLLESNYTTGSNVVINGGRHLRKEAPLD